MQSAPPPDPLKQLNDLLAKAKQAAAKSPRAWGDILKAHREFYLQHYSKLPDLKQSAGNSSITQAIEKAAKDLNDMLQRPTLWGKPLPDTDLKKHLDDMTVSTQWQQEITALNAIHNARDPNSVTPLISGRITDKKNEIYLDRATQLATLVERKNDDPLDAYRHIFENRIDSERATLAKYIDSNKNNIQNLLTRIDKAIDKATNGLLESKTTAQEIIAYNQKRTEDKPSLQAYAAEATALAHLVTTANFQNTNSSSSIDKNSMMIIAAKVRMIVINHTITTQPTGNLSQREIDSLKQQCAIASASVNKCYDFEQSRQISKADEKYISLTSHFDSQTRELGTLSTTIQTLSNSIKMPSTEPWQIFEAQEKLAGLLADRDTLTADISRRVDGAKNPPAKQPHNLETKQADDDIAALLKSTDVKTAEHQKIIEANRTEISAKSVSAGISTLTPEQLAAARELKTIDADVRKLQEDIRDAGIKILTLMNQTQQGGLLVTTAEILSVLTKAHTAYQKITALHDGAGKRLTDDKKQDSPVAKHYFESITKNLAESAENLQDVIRRQPSAGSHNTPVKSCIDQFDLAKEITDPSFREFLGIDQPKQKLAASVPLTPVADAKLSITPTLPVTPPASTPSAAIVNPAPVIDTTIPPANSIIPPSADKKGDPSSISSPEKKPPAYSSGRTKPFFAVFDHKEQNIMQNELKDWTLERPAPSDAANRRDQTYTVTSASGAKFEVTAREIKTTDQSPETFKAMLQTFMKANPGVEPQITADSLATAKIWKDVTDDMKKNKEMSCDVNIKLKETAPAPTPADDPAPDDSHRMKHS